MEDQFGDYEGDFIPLFCEKHEKIGLKEFKEGGAEKIKHKSMTAENIMKARERRKARVGNSIKPVNKKNYKPKL